LGAVPHHQSILIYINTTLRLRSTFQFPKIFLYNVGGRVYIIFMEEKIRTRKVKGEELDYYVCVECGREWKQTAKSIGHKKQACDKYHKERYGWV
jgi:hypothetical protein